MFRERLHLSWVGRGVQQNMTYKVRPREPEAWGQAGDPQVAPSAAGSTQLRAMWFWVQVLQEAGTLVPLL
jgi:hypothetical protein